MVIVDGWRLASSVAEKALVESAVDNSVSGMSTVVRDRETLLCFMKIC